ncbi:MAG TPA: hypothetical protein ENI97_15740 [Gammaproteobacteria bacterium]|nr:hypothetical protein [Gammaproteobacteria bacterium]
MKSHVTGLISVAMLVSLLFSSARADDSRIVQIIEKDILYNPSSITVHLNQKLRIKNDDPFFHKSRISVLDNDNKEGEVVMPAKKEEAHTQQDFKFSMPGHYKIRCMVHDGMTAVINVVN